MMVHVPTLINLGGFKIPVKYVDFLEEGHMGIFSAGTITISTTANRTEKELKATLFHEIVHAIFWKTGLAALFDGIDSLNVEEAVVTAIEHHLTDVININKTCFKKFREVEIGKS